MEGEVLGEIAVAALEAVLDFLHPRTRTGWIVFWTVLTLAVAVIVYFGWFHE